MEYLHTFKSIGNFKILCYQQTLLQRHDTTRDQQTMGKTKPSL